MNPNPDQSPKTNTQPLKQNEQAQRLNLVDHLLRTAPLVLPHPEFAERVMLAIRERELAAMNRYTALGIILGLTATFVIAGLFMAGMGVTVVNVLFNWTEFYQNLVLGVGVFSNWVVDTLQTTRQNATDSPVGLALAVLSVPLVWVWWRVMRNVLREGEA
ncbi:MAG: hypothetical protein ACLFTK_07290 [Anaerolineales bacterium]